MSHEIVLFGLLKSTFGLLLENEDVGQNCELLGEKLDVCIEQIRNGGMTNLMTGLVNLKSAVESLLACSEILKDTEEATIVSSSHNESKDVPEGYLEHKTELLKETNRNSELPGHESGIVLAEIEHPVCDTLQQPQANSLLDEELSFYATKHKQLQNELLKIATSDEFKQAMEHFLESKKESAKISEDEGKIKTKLTATKVLVISEILGNLKNLTAAAKNCIEYIKKLHKILKLQRRPFSTWYKALSYLNLEQKFEFQGMESMHSIMCVNVVVFGFVKEFVRKPVAMLDWPTIDVVSREVYLETYHPILGNLSTKTNAPDPFTAVNRAVLQINSSVSATNCNGEIFAKGKLADGEKRKAIITIPGNRRYDVDVENTRHILSISIDCGGCQTDKKPSSQCGDTSGTSTHSRNASCDASLGLFDKACQGKMYILAWYKPDGRVQFFLYVIDMNGITERTDKLRFLNKTVTDVSKLQAKIFCMKEKKVAIFDVIGRFIHIYDTKSKLMKAIDITEQLRNIDTYVTPPIFISYLGEIFCPVSRSKLNVYNIDVEHSTLTPTSEITLERVVKAVTFNQELDEIIILCHSSKLLQYHLVTYSKAGELKQDITLYNSTAYKEASLISHPNGSIVLLDNNKLLYLKIASSVRREQDST